MCSGDIDLDLETNVTSEIMRTFTLALVLATALIGAPLYGQSPAATFLELQSRLQLHDNEKIEITDNSGSKLKGRAAGLSAATLKVNVKGVPRELSESQVLRIRHRKPDKWWNGMLIGLGVGVGTGIVLAAACDDWCGDNAYLNGAFGGGLWGMGIGAGIDFAVRKHETIFENPGAKKSVTLRVAPIVTQNTQGARLAFRF
jgi:hypothetical protein